jgi:hypothetical protein
VVQEDLITDIDKLEWNVAQYHPPFTLPFKRRNEIWIHIDNNSISGKLKKNN